MSQFHPIDLVQHYLQMSPTGQTQAWEASAFWQATQSEDGLASPFGFLIAQFEFEDDWDHWECHPQGDEVLIVMEGQLELVLDIEGQEKKLLLKAPQAFLVPQGVWHTGNVSGYCRLLGVTAGEGTEGRPRT